jgi:hypothetical protein
MLGRAPTGGPATPVPSDAVPRPGSCVALALLALTVAACGTDRAPSAARRSAHATAAPATSSPTTSTTVAPTTTSTVAPTTSVAARVRPAPTTGPLPAAPAGGPVSAVTAAQLGGSWHPGCPVGPAQLRLLTVSYWGFDGQAHQGQLVVNVNAVNTMTTAFARLFAAQFPIRKMVTIDHYPGTGVTLDDESTADDNTAAFNCRDAVNPGGTASWSEHAFGEAVDVNPVENPYVESNGVVDPANGAPFVDRSDHRPGMAFAGSPLNATFAAAGWGWGGNWAANPDYQHFSVNGQ